MLEVFADTIQDSAKNEYTKPERRKHETHLYWKVIPQLMVDAWERYEKWLEYSRW